MFSKMLYFVAVVAALLWIEGDRLTAIKDEALDTMDGEASYTTSGRGGW